MVAKPRRQAGEVLADPMGEIVQAVRKAGAVHVDETGWREAGKTAWLWVGVTSKATAFGVHRSRGHDELEALLGEGPGGDRVIIFDRFPTYTRPETPTLMGQLRRDMQAMIDRGSGVESVGRRLLDQSRWVFTWWRRVDRPDDVEGVRGEVEGGGRPPAPGGLDVRLRLDGEGVPEGPRGRERSPHGGTGGISGQQMQSPPGRGVSNNPVFSILPGRHEP